MSGATPDPSEPARDPDAARAAAAGAGLAAGQIRDRVGAELAASGAAPDRRRTVSGGVLGRAVAGAAVCGARRRARSCSCWRRWARCCRWSGFAGRAARRRLRRLDRGTGIRHRPATALTDTLATQDPVALALWQAQRERTLASIKRIRAGLPSPRLAIHDPWALRALVAGDAGRDLCRRGRRARRCASRRRSTGTACWRRPISGSTPG